MRKAIITILVIISFTFSVQNLSSAALDEFTVDGDTLALWHMNGTVGSAAKKDNAEGTSAIDLTEVNTPGAVNGFDGASNGSYDFTPASNHSVTAADHANVSFPNQDFSIEFWIYFDALPSSGTEIDPISKWGGGQEAYLFYLLNSAGTYSLTLNVYDGSTLEGIGATWSPSPSTGQWYYLVATFDNTANEGKWYVNGQQMGSTSTITANGVRDTTSILVFGENNAGGSPLDGRMDEIRFSNKTRTATEIEDYYEGVAPTDDPKSKTGIIWIE
jgi:hypothetical protein|tara:strand:+ start:1442 stop:2260 length:819 start_codon:yes stop_codon:yes gene_type:complete